MIGMNILYVAHERNLGGASKSLVTMVSDMERRGHTVTVVVPFRSGQVFRALKEQGIFVKKIFFGWWMMPKAWNPLLKFLFRVLYLTEPVAARRIASLARKRQAKLIHSNSSAIDVGARAAKMCGLPHVWHFREFGDLDYRLIYLLGKRESARRAINVPGKIVFISKCLRQYYEQEIPDAHSTVIYNGISEKLFCEKYPDGRADRLGCGTVTFLIAGNFHEGKHQELAIEACRILCEQGFSGVRLTVAGAASALKSSKAFEERLKAEALKLPEGTVTFTGYVSDMAALRKQTDVELVCSGMEAFGRVTAEAMLSSNPVIGADSGATPELIVHGKNGFLFESGSAEALADRMRYFLEHPQEIARMGVEAYRGAKECFTARHNTDAVERLYAALLD
ncbi:MAG: glycosyltransferase family 4 protein [Lachnospiraceae bacterium]|nr:glycosyltransferase family 4 protein [Lachnospiraceae bacterium]